MLSGSISVPSTSQRSLIGSWSLCRRRSENVGGTAGPDGDRDRDEHTERGHREKLPRHPPEATEERVRPHVEPEPGGDEQRSDGPFHSGHRPCCYVRLRVVATPNPETVAARL